jgi:outer membrane protein assembly factor BamB
MCRVHRLFLALAGVILVLLAGCGSRPPTSGTATLTRPATDTPAASSSTNAQVYLVSASGALTAYAGSSGHRRWQFTPPAPQQVNVVAAGGGLVYVGTDAIVYALDAASGQQRWSVPAGSSVRVLALSADTLYAASAGTIYALAAATGAERWASTVGPVGAPFLTLDTASGALYAPAGNHLTALDLATGATRWQFHAALSDAVIQVMVAGDALVVRTRSTLVALSASDGSVRWQRTTGTDALLVQNGLVYARYIDQTPQGVVTSGLRALQLADGTVALDTALPLGDENEQDRWTSSALYRLTDPASGTIVAWGLHGAPLWQRTLGTPVSDVLVQNDQVWLAEGNAVAALDAGSGLPRWHTSANGSLGSGGNTLTWAEGRLYVWDGLFDTGQLTVLDPAVAGRMDWHLHLGTQIVQVLVA